MESYYSNIQEKLADEMLNLTKSLKDQSIAANKIIKKDTEVSLFYSRILFQASLITISIVPTGRIKVHSNNCPESRIFRK
jgi:hypothetical protein